MANITNKLESYLKIMSQSDYFFKYHFNKKHTTQLPFHELILLKEFFLSSTLMGPGPGGWQMSQQLAKHSSLLEDLHFFRQFSRQLLISALTSPDVSIIITTTSMKKLLVRTPFASIVEFLTTLRHLHF